MGGKTQQSSSQVTIPPEVLARYNSVNATAETAAQTPFQSYGGQFVAGLTPTQQAGITNTNDAAGSAQPFINAGADLTLGSATDLQPDQYSGQAVGQYLNPFIGSVYGATAANIDRQNAVQQQSMLGDQVKANAFGGDRGGIQRAELARSQNLAGQQTLANILNTGFQGAQNEFNTQQQIDLGAQQNTAARMAAAGQTLGSLGIQGQQAALAGAGAQMQAGQIEQGTQQADLTAQYNQFLQGKSYPFQVAQFLANIAMGTGALSGSTTTSTSPAPFFSDERLKENIHPVGKTFDGQTIHRYNYKGDNRTQIGLLAQDVAHKAPHAVGQDSGYLTVDYDKATQHAAGLGAAAHAGRQGLAAGGVPYQNDNGGGNYPKPGSYVPAANLPVGQLITAKLPAEKQTTGLADAAKTAGSLAGLYKDGKSMYGDMTKPDKEVYLGDNQFGYADGGGVDDDGQQDYPGEPIKGPDVHSFVPKADLPVAGLHPADAPKGGGSGGGLGDVASIASSAAKILPFFLASRGGAIGHYAAGGAPEDYDPIFQDAEAETGVPARLLRAQAQTESGLRNGLVGKSGERGLMQVMPSTARDPGFGLAGVDPASLDDPRQNIMFGARYLKARGDRAGVSDYNDPDQWAKALRTYNGGGDPNYVQKTFRNAGLGNASAYAPDGVRPVSDLPSRSAPRAPAAGFASAAPSRTDYKGDSRGMFDGLSEGLSGVTDRLSNMGDTGKASLLAGLFGMLASRSPWLGNAIGEGGLAGVKTYQDMEKLKATNEFTNAQASSTRVDALNKSIITDKDGYPLGVWTINGYMPYGDWQKHPVAPAGYVPSGDIVARQQRAMGVRTPDTYGQTRDLGANGQPETRRMAPAAPAAGTSARPNQPLTAPPPGRVDASPLPPPDGNQAPPAIAETQIARPTVPPPVSDLSPGMVAAAQGEVGYAGSPTDQIARTEAKKLTDEVHAQAEVNRQMRPIMNDLTKTVAKMPESGPLAQGTGAEQRIALAKALNSITRVVGLGDYFDSNQVSQLDISEKIRNLQAQAQAGDMKAAYAVEMFKHTVPGLNMTPDAAATMVSEMYRQRQRSIDRGNELPSYIRTSQGRALDYDKKFDENHKGYDNEAHIIKDMILQRSATRNNRTLMDVYLDGGVSDKSMAERYDKAYGPGTWAKMKRYFQ